MGKAAEIISTDPLLLPPDLVNDNFVTQCLHILPNISGHMDVATTREEIATPRQLGTRTSPQRITRLTVEIMDAHNAYV